MSEEVDTRVTLSLHPRNVRELDSYDEETATILGPTETAFSEAYDGIGKVHDARDAASRNPTWNEAHQLIEVDGFAQKQFGHIAARFDNVAINLNKIVSSIETDLAAPIQSQSSQTLSGEIRSYVANLPDGKRMAFVQQAITDNDTRTASAVLGGPAYLSGITPDMQSVLTRIYHEHHEPLKAKRLRAAQGALSLIGERAGLVFSQLEKAVGAPPHKIAKLRAAKSAAEKHFIANQP